MQTAGTIKGLILSLVRKVFLRMTTLARKTAE
jgi:hypothetical protein